MIPGSVYTPLGTNATFKCGIDNDPDETIYFDWVIKGVDGVNIIIDMYSIVEKSATLRQRGIYFKDNGSQIILEVEATIENNGSTVECRELFDLPPADIKRAQLHITGIQYLNTGVRYSI